MRTMIGIKNLNFNIGAFSLKDITLQVMKGEYFVLMGPNGSGKTLFLECICGLRRLKKGSVELNNQDMTYCDPSERNIGYVPQDYALIPFKTVEQNIAFGLEARNLEREYILAEVNKVMNFLNIVHLKQRLPDSLSGGERQKTALGRALAIKPDILLLDEPLSALDETVRDELCYGLKKIQRESGVTIIHVCHNFSELLCVADRVGILSQGELVQAGSLEEILRNPGNKLKKNKLGELLCNSIKSKIGAEK